MNFKSRLTVDALYKGAWDRKAEEDRNEYFVNLNYYLMYCGESALESRGNLLG